jgi:predicted transcriptional regulator
MICYWYNQRMSLSSTSYRDRVYIIQDIILKLVEYGELNQTALISFTGLNLKKHRCILDELEVNGLIQKSESPFGKRMVIVYKPTQKGIEFCRSILEPYERMFPRKKESSVVIVNNNTNNASNVKPTRKTIGGQQEIELQQQQKLQPKVSEQITTY